MAKTLSFPAEKRREGLIFRSLDYLQYARIGILCVYSSNISLFLYNSIYIGDGVPFIGSVKRMKTKTLAETMLIKVHIPVMRESVPEEHSLTNLR